VRDSNTYKPLFVMIVIFKHYKHREMRIISFDVGMKNLAYCLFDIPDSLVAAAAASNLIHHIRIERWDVIDLRFEPVDPEDKALPTEVIAAPPKRTCMNDTKLAKWMYLPPNSVSTSTSSSASSSALLYCAKCAEKSNYKTPSREILPYKRKPDLIAKKKLVDLMDIKGNLSTSSSMEIPPINIKLRKADLIKEITTILSRDYMEPFDETKYTIYTTTGGTTLDDAKPKKPNYTYAHDLDLITYGRNLMKHLDVILYSSKTDNTSIDMMIIENQISTLASRMKTLQGMITQYFIMKNIPQIEFISASCKLKLFTDSTHHADADADADKLVVDASTYSDRKKSGIAVCRSLGEISRKRNSDYAKWMPVFENHKKKDDLADCFLQGLWRVHLLCAV
jgi:hypothetical protein